MPPLQGSKKWVGGLVTQGGGWRLALGYVISPLQGEEGRTVASSGLKTRPLPLLGLKGSGVVEGSSERLKNPST